MAITNHKETHEGIMHYKHIIRACLITTLLIDPTASVAQSGILVSQLTLNGRVALLPGATATVGKGVPRVIWLTGPWMDHVSVVLPAGGVTATIGEKKTYVGSGEVQITLNASATAARGPVSLSFIIDCRLKVGCTPGPIPLPVTVFETGPIATITATTPVVPGAAITLTLTGTGMGIARLGRPGQVQGATITNQGGNTLTVTGTLAAWACGPVSVEVTDPLSGDGWPFRNNVQPGSRPNTGTTCPMNRPATYCQPLPPATSCDPVDEAVRPERSTSLHRH